MEITESIKSPQTDQFTPYTILHLTALTVLSLDKTHIVQCMDQNIFQSIHWKVNMAANLGRKCKIQLYIQRISATAQLALNSHDDVIKWKHFPRNWPFVRGIHRSPVNSPQKGQWRGALMFSLICAWINDWVNNREVGDFRRHRSHYDVIVM